MTGIYYGLHVLVLLCFLAILLNAACTNFATEKVSVSALP